MCLELETIHYISVVNTRSKTGEAWSLGQVVWA